MPFHDLTPRLDPLRHMGTGPLRTTGSIDGGNVPVTPWSKNRECRGPARSNTPRWPSQPRAAAELRPDIGTARLKVRNDLELSRSLEMRLPLLSTAILHGRINAPVAASTGAHTSGDTVQCWLAGSDDEASPGPHTVQVLQGTQ